MEIHDLTETQNAKRRTVNAERFCAALVLSLLFTVLRSAFLLAAVPDGYVVKVDSATAYLDWGEAAGVKPGDTFSVYRLGAELKHPVTGEVLGHAENKLGSGMLDQVEEKFSVGHLMEGAASIKAGDRTRYSENASGPRSAGASETAVAVAPMPRGAEAPTPKELWRSEPLPDEAAAIAVGDVDGDGKKEVVVAYQRGIEVFRWNGQKLESVASFRDRTYRHWISVAVADLRHAGHDEIFTSAYFDAVKRPHLVVLRWDEGKLKKAADIEGTVRAIDRADGSRVLAWQNLLRTREPSFSEPQELTVKGDAYVPGPSLRLSRVREDELLGYTLGDWDQDKAEDLALLQGGERLRIFFHDQKWSASEVYGGTRNDLALEGDQLTSVYPRLVTWHAAGKPDRLLVPHNIPDLGIRLSRLKLFKRSELVALGWNGLEMVPLWRLPLEGYLADFDLGDGMAAGQPQLWVALANRGHKTVLIAYGL